MPAATTVDAERRRLIGIDHEVEEVKAAFQEALEEVTARPEIDGSIGGRLAEVGRRLAGLKPQLEEADLSDAQKATLYSALLDVTTAMSGEPRDLNRFEAALVGIERVRHVIRDAIDEFVGGAGAGRRRLLEEVDSSLPGVAQADLAELLAVDPRTVRRWRSSDGEPAHRLRLVARLVAILRHAWTPKGVLAWFRRPRRDLGGKTPMELLGEPGAERVLLAAARASRNQYAT